MDEKVFAEPPRSWIDSLGTSVSIACAIQCSVLPLLVGILPLLGLGFLLGDGIEKVFLASSTVLAVSSFSWGFRYHRRFYVFVFLASAAALIIAGRLCVDERYELPFVVSGSLILTAGHFLNRRLCRLCAECGENRQMREHVSAHVRSKGRKEKRS
ncbi:MAG TPA: MerC domain-containing protein [Candidatus Binatia bacterium]|jgi:hypothetical protein